MLASTLAESPSKLPTGHWWVAAFVSGIALAVAAWTMVPRKVGPRLVACSLPLISGSFVFLREEDTEQALILFTLATATLAILRLIFARWLASQQRLARAGKPVTTLTRAQTTIFLLTLLGVLISLVVTGNLIEATLT